MRNLVSVYCKPQYKYSWKFSFSEYNINNSFCSYSLINESNADNKIVTENKYKSNYSIK